MIINCPICGPREAAEYSYIGDATRVRPEADNIDLNSWSDYVHQRQNPRGNHHEHWQHSGACRSILCVTRDTLSHAISGVKLVGPYSEDTK